MLSAHYSVKIRPKMGGFQWLVGVLLLVTVSLDAEEANVCTEKGCADIAAEFLANMDPTVDPCEDFFKFACAKYPDRYPIPDDKTAVNRMSQIGDLVNQQIKDVLEEPITDDEPKHFANVKKYYKACMNTENLEKIGLSHVKALIDSMGGWPVVEDKDPSATWETVLYKFKDFGLKSGNLLQVSKELDMKNTKAWILSIDSADLGIDQATLLEGKDNQNVKLYYDAMVSVAKLFGATEENAKKDMADALDFEITLAKSKKTRAEINADLNAMYNIYDLESLQSNFSEFPWDNYLKHFIPESVKLEKNQRILVSEPAYIQKLTELLKKTDQKILRNYLIFESVWAMVSFLNKDAAAISQKYTSTITGQQKESPRSEECLGSVMSVYLPVASALYVQRYSNANTKKLATEMMLNLQAEFIDILSESDWPEEDKKEGIEKIKNYYAHVAFPNELADNKIMAAYYGDIDVDENDYLRSTLDMLKDTEEIKWNQLPHPVNRTTWLEFANAAVVNAYYKMDQNIIVLPAAILQGVYFNENRPRYVNYAAMGSAIAHEMSHGFDSDGHQFDKDGLLRNWQTEAGAANYKEKEQCIIKQYSKFSIHDTKLDGTISVGENMADFGGWKAAYRSYRDWEAKNGPEPGLPGLNYTNHQLFWIASSNIWCENERKEATLMSLNSDPHAPSQFRVNGALSNLKMFSEDFACPVGSKMNPADKCLPW